MLPMSPPAPPLITAISKGASTEARARTALYGFLREFDTAQENNKLATWRAGMPLRINAIVAAIAGLAGVKTAAASAGSEDVVSVHDENV